MSENPSQDQVNEVSSVLSRVNQFGLATERLFNRLYSSIDRRSKNEHQRQEMEARLERLRRTKEQNLQLRESLRRRAEEIERLYGILSIITEGVIMQDNEGRIVFINKAARDLLGSQKNFWQTELGMLFEEFHQVTQTDTELQPLGDPRRIQVNNRILGAQLAAVANDEGQRLGTMIVLRDFTREAVADRLKDQFVTAISHELKTPMTVIKGMSEVIIGQPADAPVNRRFLETLSRNVDILDRMVVELLDVSEMGAGTFDIRQNELTLNRLLWTVIKGAEPELSKNTLEIKFTPRVGNSFYIIGDDQRLRWAMGHLLQNSIHYTEPGGSIIVTTRLEHDQPGFVFIDFIDNGVGISENDLPHIFDRFYRGDPRNADGRLVDPRGLGQGLFVARTVAEAHGGYVSVESQVGQGTMFTLALPISER